MKMLGVKFPNVKIPDTQFVDRIVEINPVIIKETINDMLFKKGCNYILTFYNNVLYVIEPSLVGGEYVKRQIQYHPLADKVTE